MQKFYLPRKKSSFYRPDTFLQWGGLAILAVILYGNLSPVGWAGMSLVGDMFIMICWIIPFYFVPLSFYLPAMMTSLALIVQSSLCIYH